MMTAVQRQRTVFHHPGEGARKPRGRVGQTGFLTSSCEATVAVSATLLRVRSMSSEGLADQDGFEPAVSWHEAKLDDRARY